ISELNKHLKTEVQVEDIELSFFHSFPQAAIEFKHVFIADAYPDIVSDDTLFHAESMFFNFNVMDLYSGNYEVQRVSVRNGGLFLKTTSDGQQNFDIIERSTDSTEENDNFTFRLELLEVENVEFRYRSLAAQQFYDLDVHNGLFQGDFS